ncbi:leukocyte surface antigen CD53-like isoform X2 [Ostrea edulis]|uniref:leukocyte surface antigen CD53-like isoform X2 n=1 Tax=Ostrea edulis TaxID=37623 RepID=UPI0020961646|nr:leukocyte surface antigen CD53-like isoform X2 [Ostrea edulis]
MTERIQKQKCLHLNIHLDDVACSYCQKDYELSKPLRKSTNKKYSTTSNDTSQRSATHSRRIHIRAARRKKDRCFHYLAGVLHCYNVFLLVLGSGVMGSGIWLLVKDYNARELSILFNNLHLEYMAYFVTCGGGAVFVLAFCGCCGTMKKEKFVLGFYGGVLTLVLLVLVGGSVMGFLLKGKLEEDIKEHFEDTLKFQYGMDINKNSQNNLITDAWDAMQRTLKCCGPFGGKDSTTSWMFYRNTKWVLKRPSGRSYPYVPKSCCVSGMNTYDCQGMGNEFNGAPVVISERGTVDNPNLYKEGCYDKAVDYIKNHSLYITIGCATVPILLSVGIVVSCYMCCTVKNDDEEDEEDEENEAHV